MSGYAIGHCVSAAVVVVLLLTLSAFEDHPGARYYQRVAALWAFISILWAATP